ncbi:uncharacterized protein BJ212DRAFT_1299175 [Suillus subaureus]|uniref:Uncharacterized protein n=1 Tax=Suillus subaureus TaxID=48587 RepID=A0A9P7ED72_9AGAM|nr:uncharacterized protein BJ212DRAFT_1299175 [Suillus subaureus]KAG1817650.1 hypothetical protein BJ212DRAFT_1299175 [Suillus subaureus]
MVLGLLAVLPYTPFYLLTSAVWLKQCQYACQRQCTDQHMCYTHIQMTLHGLNSLSLQMLEIVYCNGSNASCKAAWIKFTLVSRQNKTRAAALPAVTAIPTASAAIPAAADFSTAAAIPAAIPTTIPTVIPAAAAANSTTLQNPHWQQLPVRYRTSDAAHTGPDEGEVFDLDNVSGDEEEPGNLPVPVITMAPHCSH